MYQEFNIKIEINSIFLIGPKIIWKMILS